MAVTAAEVKSEEVELLGTGLTRDIAHATGVTVPYFYRPLASTTKGAMAEIKNLVVIRLFVKKYVISQAKPYTTGTHLQTSGCHK